MHSDGLAAASRSTSLAALCALLLTAAPATASAAKVKTGAHPANAAAKHAAKPTPKRRPAAARPQARAQLTVHRVVSTPGTITIVSNDSGMVQLSWATPGDFQAGDHYRLYRNNIVIASLTTPAFTDRTALVGMPLYRVSVITPAGSESRLSPTALVPVFSGGGSPAKVRAVSSGGSAPVVSWYPQPGAARYDVLRDGSVVATVAAAGAGVESWTDTAAIYGDHSYSVRGESVAGTPGTSSSATSVTVADPATPAPVPPAPPIPLVSVTPRAAAALTSGAPSISWDAQPGTVVFIVTRDGTEVSQLDGRVFTDSGVSEGTHSYQVYGVDALGVWGPAGPAVTTTVDRTAPAVITPAPTLTSAAFGSVSISWTDATDPSDIKGYVIYRGGHQIGTTTDPAFTDTTRYYGTQSYTVAAIDNAGNTSAQSAGVSATVTFHWH